MVAKAREGIRRLTPKSAVLTASLSDLHGNSADMKLSDEESFRRLKTKHQQLYTEWRRKKGPCIICGEREGNEKDHLPPKVLFPKMLRTDKTEFFTFPVCSLCNRGSSDNDFLFSVLLSLDLNQESYLNNREPTDPDLLALHTQTQVQFEDSPKAKHRLKLLGPYIGKDPYTGRDAINASKLPINSTITKIVKSTYWLQTGGDILQTYNPGWWILHDVDTSKTNFIEKHLEVTNAEIHWGDRFITHYAIGHPENGVGGFISCSLHFYTKRAVGAGISWYAIASPVTTEINNQSLFDISQSIFGDPTIPPSRKIKPDNAQ